MVMTLSMNWMHEASNGTSSETGDHGKVGPDVDEEKSKQAEPDVDKEKFEKVGPDVDEEKSEQAEPNVKKEESKSNEDAEEWSAETSFWTSNPRANKYSSAVEDEVEIKDCWEHEKNAHCRPKWWKSRKNQDETEVSGVELCLASLTHGQDFCPAR